MSWAVARVVGAAVVVAAAAGSVSAIASRMSSDGKIGRRRQIDLNPDIVCKNVKRRAFIASVTLRRFFD
jgi:hypothetical protein